MKIIVFARDIAHVCTGFQSIKRAQEKQFANEAEKRWIVNKVLFSSKSDEWSTPDEVYKALDKEFGFTLDAAASEENHKADRYFTKKHDGLMASWGGANRVLQSPI